MNTLTVNCTMEAGSTPREHDHFALIELEELSVDGVETEMVWAVDHNMQPGMNSFEDEGVEWEALRRPMLETRVFVIGRPS